MKKEGLGLIVPVMSCSHSRSAMPDSYVLEPCQTAFSSLPLKSLRACLEGWSIQLKHFIAVSMC